MASDCVCPLEDLKTAAKDYFRWEHILFRSNVVMTQDQIDTAAEAFQEARDRVLNLLGDGAEE